MVVGPIQPAMQWNQCIRDAITVLRYSNRYCKNPIRKGPPSLQNTTIGSDDLLCNENYECKEMLPLPHKLIFRKAPRSNKRIFDNNDQRIAHRITGTEPGGDEGISTRGVKVEYQTILIAEGDSVGAVISPLRISAGGAGMADGVGPLLAQERG